VVDTTNNDEAQAPAPVPGPPKPKSPIVVFLASSTGRLIVGGVLLFTVIVIAGAYLFISLLNQTPPVTPVTGPSGASGDSSQTALEATRPPELPMDDTFTFRNVFAPTVKPPVKKTTTTSSSSSSSSDTSSSSDVPKNTLLLKSIVTSNGKKVAILYWNGTDYKCHAGDTVDSSPWKVLTIYSDSVLMLYGDSRVTLTVGQGFSK
jgi:hypothetical protein